MGAWRLSLVQPRSEITYHLSMIGSSLSDRDDVPSVHSIRVV